jgi:hypothetical protein
MARCRFLASTPDSRVGKEGTVYGRGHETDFDADDYDYVIEMWHTGRVEIFDWSGITPPAGQNVTPPEEAA